jgi:hypothetical protein
VIIPTGYLQANFRFTGVAAPNGAEVTLGFEIADFVSPTPDGVANALADAWSPTMMEWVSSELTFSECYVKFGPNDTGPSGTAQRAVPGVNAATAAPPNVSVLHHKTTNLGGRRGRGRFYLPGIPEAFITGSGMLSGASFNLYQVAVDDFDAASRTTGLIPALLHADSPLSATPPPTEVNAYVVDPLVATQRDRLRR